MMCPTCLKDDCICGDEVIALRARVKELEERVAYFSDRLKEMTADRNHYRAIIDNQAPRREEICTVCGEPGVHNHG